MHLKKISVFVALTAFPIFAIDTSPPDISLKTILRQAAAVSPQIQAARLRDVASEHRIAIAESGFLPTVNLEAIDTTGFPGSAAHLGVEGMIASPYREGAAAGVSANIPIWDFGRTTNSIDVAKHEALSSQEDTKYTRYQTYETGVHLFYECALDRGLKESWTDLAEGAKLVQKEIDRFVKTGQRSVVERYLVESQMQHAMTQVAIYQEREKNQVKEISLITGINAETFSCANLPTENEAVAYFQGTPEGNPIISSAQEQVFAARARIDQAKADYLPRLVAVADAAVMQDQRFVQPSYYSLGVALIIPVFEGFSTLNKVREASALETSAEKELESRKLEIADLNVKYDKVIESTRTAVGLLKAEFELAKKGYKLAKARYFSLEGGVTDVRDSFDDLSRTQTVLIATKAEYLEAMAAKAVLNGTPF